MSINPLVDEVRFLIADLDEDEPLLTDEQFLAALTAEGGHPLLAAARCLDTIAVSEVLLSKKIRTQDLSTDGPAVAAELRAQARAFRDRARAGDDLLGDFDGFDLVDGGPGRRRPELAAEQVWGL